MNTILVIGSLPEEGNREEFENLAFRIGKTVVAQGLTLLTGGDSDPVVVDKFAASGAESWCKVNGRPVNEQVKSVVREGVVPHNIGKCVRSTGDVEPEQVIRLMKRASAIIVCGGAKSTKEYLVFAEETATPIIPIPVFDGEAEKYFDKYRWVGLPDYFRESVRGEDFDDVNQMAKSDVSLDAIAEAAVSLAKNSLLASNNVFVATPFSQNYDNTFRAIDEAIKMINDELPHRQFKLGRLDKEEEVVKIDEALEKHIRNAKIVIADLSEASTNVYYEFGLARGHGVIVVPIAAEGTKPSFNVEHFRIEFYDLSESDNKAMDKKIARFAELLKNRIKALMALT